MSEAKWERSQWDVSSVALPPPWCQDPPASRLGNATVHAQRWTKTMPDNTLMWIIVAAVVLVLVVGLAVVVSR